MGPTDEAPAGGDRGRKPDADAERRRAALKARLFELSDRAKAGDRAALDGLRRLLDGHPELWRALGDLAALARRSWVELVAGDFPALAESVGREVAELRRELEGPAPSPTERLLVEQVLACRLEVHHAALAAARPGPGGLEQAAFALRRSESAQRRYLGALKLLTAVRALVPQGLAPVPAPALAALPARARVRRPA